MASGDAVVPVWRVFQVTPWSVEYWYDVIGDAPPQTGASNETLSCCDVEMMSTMSGAPAGPTVRAWTLLDGVPSPWPLTARIAMRYSVFPVRATGVPALVCVIGMGVVKSAGLRARRDEPPSVEYL